MSEPLSNIGFRCDHHAPTADSQLASWPAETFVGRFVKRAFPVLDAGPLLGKLGTGATLEHMWVRVERVEAGVLVGTLGNDPLCDVGVVFGDAVTVRLEEIEDVLPPLAEETH